MRLYMIVFGLMLSLSLAGQVNDKVYNPEANAANDLAAAIAKAKETKKHVFVTVGGNWCRWCLKFDKMMNEDEELNMLLKSGYVDIKINYDQNVKNPEMMKKLQFPQRFGFPVFIILDENGNRLHTQDSGLLEDGLGYNRRKIVEFLRSWTKAAIDPSNY